MPKQFPAYAHFSLNLQGRADTKIKATADHDGPADLRGVYISVFHSDGFGGLNLWLGSAQARELRLQLSQALEAYYREHAGELAADIERDLTMKLVPDLPQPADPCPVCGGGHDRISRSDCPEVSIDEAIQRG